ncbi:NUDIX hydrolase [Tatumella sp. TA1]|uniref:NUDIX hydrolase n=1 Tax=Rosenbergiella collisarenosi TaxID=1544695 RepID=UPI0008F8E5E9|nr:NUDIX hydrolase [Rosenbergiella collisarenosi]MBT0721100.1 NUDIX hydrolase [Rosenbergiella collisarenosi]QGX91218.1 NUDIX hydrolase [Tatumella sp. TA1]
MFTPHITVACVIHAQGRLLVVEERVDGAVTLNQPAGHLEAQESLIDAMQREILEETGLTLSPEHLLGVHQWTAKDGTPFIRFLFSCEVAACLTTAPQDDDIDCCHWLTPDEILSSDQLRSPLVAESVTLWQSGQRYPLTVLNWFVQ